METLQDGIGVVQMNGHQYVFRADAMSVRMASTGLPSLQTIALVNIKGTMCFEGVGVDPTDKLREQISQLQSILRSRDTTKPAVSP